VDSIDALNPCATQFDPEGVGGLFDSIERSISGSISVPEVKVLIDLDLPVDKSVTGGNCRESLHLIFTVQVFTVGTLRTNLSLCHRSIQF